ncbi:hypothetical protein [Mucisphaera sp.]|uniref:hypothetical protein n=1 Tax=Mucisphaera sp. TaxID=2913024 RepID=UPI003D0E6CED
MMDGLSQGLRALVVVCLLVAVVAAQQPEPVRILFIGNSYTYFNNLPEQIDQMAESRGIDVEIERVLKGGYSFERHWLNEDGSPGDAQVAIAEEGPWDLIVLQEFSTGTLWQRRPSFFAYGERFVDHIREHESEDRPTRVVMYLTWARRWMPETQPWITQGYSEFAVEHEVEVAPVGEAWRVARLERPALELFDPDQTHPGPAGSYLGACVFFETIFGQTAEGLPRRMEGEKVHPRDGLPTLVDLSEEDALFLQRLAGETVVAFDPEDHAGSLGEAPPWRNPPVLEPDEPEPVTTE